MKEYCLIPKSTAEQFLLKSSTGSRNIKRNRKTDEEKKEKRVRKPLSGSTVKASTALKNIKRRALQDVLTPNNHPPSIAAIGPRTTFPTNTIDSKPAIDNRIDVRMKAAQRDYAKAFLALMKHTPGITWDTNGNLLSPINNFNVIDILQTLSDVNSKLGFKADDIPFIKMLFHNTNLDPSFIRNNKARKQLFGGGGGGGRRSAPIRAKPRPTPSFSAPARMPGMTWENYRV